MMRKWTRTKQHVPLTGGQGSSRIRVTLQEWGLSLPPPGLGVSKGKACPSGLENCGFSHRSRSITPGLFTSALRFYASVTFSHFMWDYVLCVPKSS